MSIAVPFRFILILSLFNLLAVHLPASAADLPGSSLKTRNAREEQPHIITILSIIPAQGEPETNVTLSGSGFTSGTTAYLGNTQTRTEVLGPKLLTFTIPDLAPGLYALFLKDADGTISRTYNFSLLPPKPVIFSISPDSIEACASDRERRVTVSGQNFAASSQVMLDGAAIKGSFISRESFEFTAPYLAPGLHQVQIKNPGDTISGAQGLFIESKPEIDTVSKSEEYVTYYNLNISGRNFQQNSVLVVTEQMDLDQSSTQPSQVYVKRLRSGNTNPLERDRIIFVNCSELIYQRFPYSTVMKNFQIQVVNPGGEESEVYQVSAP